jgi:hypothetical protein
MTVASRSIVYGGLTVGMLDGLYAVIVWALRGVTAKRVFQGVATGWLGRQAAASGGWATFFLGLTTHFFIAFSVAAVYYVAARQLPVLVRKWVLAGLLYGMAVHMFMSFVVIPLSRMPGGRFNWRGFLMNIAAHAVLVGLPAAYFAQRGLRGR